MVSCLRITLGRRLDIDSLLPLCRIRGNITEYETTLLLGDLLALLEDLSGLGLLSSLDRKSVRPCNP